MGAGTSLSLCQGWVHLATLSDQAAATRPREVPLRVTHAHAQRHLHCPLFGEVPRRFGEVRTLCRRRHVGNNHTQAPAARTMRGAAPKPGDAGPSDPAAELARLRRMLASKEEENSAIMDLQKQLQAQLREAVQRADAADVAAAAAKEKTAGLERDLGEASVAVADLARQLGARDDDALRLDKELGQAKKAAAQAAAAAGEAAAYARDESTGLVQAEAHAAAAELRAEKLAAAAEVRCRRCACGAVVRREARRRIDAGARRTRPCSLLPPFKQTEAPRPSFSLRHRRRPCTRRTWRAR